MPGLIPTCIILTQCQKLKTLPCVPQHHGLFEAAQAAVQQQQVQDVGGLLRSETKTDQLEIPAEVGQLEQLIRMSQQMLML